MGSGGLWRRAGAGAGAPGAAGAGSWVLGAAGARLVSGAGGRTLGEEVSALVVCLARVFVSLCFALLCFALLCFALLAVFLEGSSGWWWWRWWWWWWEVGFDASQVSRQGANAMKKGEKTRFFYFKKSRGQSDSPGTPAPRRGAALRAAALPPGGPGPWRPGPDTGSGERPSGKDLAVTSTLFQNAAASTILVDLVHPESIGLGPAGPLAAARRWASAASRIALSSTESTPGHAVRPVLREGGSDSLNDEAEWGVSFSSLLLLTSRGPTPMPVGPARFQLHRAALSLLRCSALVLCCRPSSSFPTACWVPSRIQSRAQTRTLLLFFFFYSSVSSRARIQTRRGTRRDSRSRQARAVSKPAPCRAESASSPSSTQRAM